MSGTQVVRGSQENLPINRHTCDREPRNTPSATVVADTPLNDLPPPGRAGCLARPPARPLLTPLVLQLGISFRPAGQTVSSRSPWERWWTRPDAIWPALFFPGFIRSLPLFFDLRVFPQHHVFPSHLHRLTESFISLQPSSDLKRESKRGGAE